MSDPKLWEADLLDDANEVMGTPDIGNPPVQAWQRPVTNKILEPAITYPTIRFKVPGIPSPQGSKRGFALKKGGKFTGKVAMVESSTKVKSFRADVKDFADQAMAGNPLLDGPIRLSCLFQVPRPNSHYTSRRSLTKSAPLYPGHQLGDLDKLTRAVCDAMTGIVFKDDSQVTSYFPPYGKRYGLEAATYIVVEPDPLDY
jgi:Holliday junction resolvase RusA-like endonuclease